MLRTLVAASAFVPIALALVLTLRVAHAQETEKPAHPTLADLSFLVGEFEGRGKHPYGDYDETITSAWILGDRTLELRSKSTMNDQPVFEDLRLFSFDPETKTLRLRQYSAGLLREYSGARTATGDLVFTETAHEGPAPDAWRYTFTPSRSAAGEPAGFTYRVDSQTTGTTDWTLYVEGTLAPHLRDPGAAGPNGMRQYDAVIKGSWGTGGTDGLSAQVHHPDGEGPFPAIVFSPGGNAATTQGYQPYGRWYASWGFITVIVAFDDTAADVRAEKFGLIADWLGTEHKRDGSPLQGMVDLRHIAAAGHSRGGGAALRASRSDNRFIACLALAPSGPTEAFDVTDALAGGNTPRVCIVAAGDDEQHLPAAKAAFEGLDGCERFLIEIDGMTHMLAPREQTLRLVARSTAFLRIALANDARYRTPLTAPATGLTITQADR